MQKRIKYQTKQPRQEITTEFKRKLAGKKCLEAWAKSKYQTKIPKDVKREGLLTRPKPRL